MKLKTKNLNLRVEPAFYDKLREAADEKRWSITTYVEEAILKAFSQRN